MKENIIALIVTSFMAFIIIESMLTGDTITTQHSVVH